MSAPVTFAKSRRKRYAACGDVVRITGLRFAPPQGESSGRKTKNKTTALSCDGFVFGADNRT